MKIELLYESKKNAFLLTFNKHVITIFRWWPIQFYIRPPRRSVKALEADIPKRRPAHRPIKAEEPLKRAAFGQVELIQPNLEHWVNKTFQQQVSSKNLEFFETFCDKSLIFEIKMKKIVCSKLVEKDFENGIGTIHLRRRNFCVGGVSNLLNLPTDSSKKMPTWIKNRENLPMS